MKYLTMLFLFVSMSAFSEQTANTFSIAEVGVSANTGTVFITTLENANSVCENPKQFKVDINDPIADKFYSLALMAYAANKRLHIFYDTDVGGCIESGIRVKVARVVD